MSNGQENNLTSPDAFDIICTQVRRKFDELEPHGTLEFSCKLEKHDGRMTDGYLGKITEEGFVVTEHFRP